MGRRIDLTGQKFGKLTVIGVDNKRDLNGNIYWKCKCDCGNITVVNGRSLRTGGTKSCGCYKKDFWDNRMKKVFKDMTGERYGCLTVIRRGEDYICGDNRHTTIWICQCDCGNITQTTRTMLITGRKKSCGCMSHKFAQKHGECGTRLYRIWRSMLDRCENKSHIHYSGYGGRGITICDEWHSYLGFSEWAKSNGYQENLTIDRIDVNGNYEPSNCRWATTKEQGRNRRNNHFLTFNGETRTVSEWAEITGINRGILFKRIKAGWKIDDVLSIPPNKGNKINH